MNSIVETSVLFTPPSFLIAAPANLTPVGYFKGAVYWIYTDADGRPFVTRVGGDGKITSGPLDDNPKYRMVPDTHNQFSLGVDADGFIHVAGNMHNYTGRYPGRAGIAENAPDFLEELPERGSEIHYWRSKTPDSVTGGFAFSGLKADLKPEGSGYSLPRFFNDNNGVLFMTALCKGVDGNHLPGLQALCCHRYDVKTKAWKALGAPPPKEVGRSDVIRYNTVLAWEKSGFDNGWFQGFFATFTFDSKNRLHACWSICAYGQPFNDRLMYGRSDDLGETWVKADGTKIPGLPLRAKDEELNCADVVAKRDKDGFDLNSCVLVDANDNPSVCSDTSWYMWDGKKWNDDIQHNKLRWAKGRRGIYSKKLGATVFVEGYNRVLVGADVSDTPYGISFGPNVRTVQNVSEAAFKEAGEIYAVGVATDQKTQSLYKAKFVDAPLPTGWSAKDIVITGLELAGNAGYKDGVFVTTDYGTVIDNDLDNFLFVYKKLSGDGSIIARVANQNLPSISNAGVMMRNSLDSGSAHAYMCIAPNRGGAIYRWRPVLKGWGATVSVKDIKDPYWVKMTRAGKVFTGAISKDGKTWEDVAKQDIDMSKDVYVGLAAVSYSPIGEHKVSFDNVATLSAGDGPPVPPPVPPVVTPPPTEKQAIIGEAAFDTALGELKKKFFK